MENNLCRVPTDMGSQSPVVIDGFPPRTTPNALLQSNSFDLNNQDHIMTGFPVLSALQGEPMNGLHTNIHTPNVERIVDSNALVTLLGRNAARDALICSSRLTGNTQFQDQAAGGTAISSHATFLAAKFGLQENLNNFSILAPSICPLDILGTYALNGCYNASLATFVNCGYEDVLGNTNTKWETKYPIPLVLVGKSPVRAELQPYSSAANIIPDGWVSSHSGKFLMWMMDWSFKWSSLCKDGLLKQRKPNC